MIRASCLLSALFGFFALLVALVPVMPLRGWAPTAMFFGALLLFKLLSGFEPPRET